MEPNKWITSTRSGNNGECTMCKRLPDGTTLVKDSKDPDGPVLTFTPGDWAAFVEGVKDGEFDLNG